VSRAVLSIGSNLGDALGHLRAATAAFAPWLLSVSPVVQTPPWGPVKQDYFLNAVLVVSDAHATAEDWLARSQAVEDAEGRERTIRWGPRSLDVDVVCVSQDGQDVLSDDPVLTLPHPRAAVRAFVLVPWLALDPAAVLRGVPVAELVERLPADEVAGIEFRPKLTLT